jgi:hypothetical protein
MKKAVGGIEAWTHGCIATATPSSLPLSSVVIGNPPLRSLESSKNIYPIKAFGHDNAASGDNAERHDNIASVVILREVAESIDPSTLQYGSVFLFIDSATSRRMTSDATLSYPNVFIGYILLLLL